MGGPLRPKLLSYWTCDQCVNDILETIFSKSCVANLMTLSINSVIIILLDSRGIPRENFHVCQKGENI